MHAYIHNISLRFVSGRCAYPPSLTAPSLTARSLTAPKTQASDVRCDAHTRRKGTQRGSDSARRPNSKRSRKRRRVKGSSKLAMCANKGSSNLRRSSALLRGTFTFTCWSHLRVCVCILCRYVYLHVCTYVCMYDTYVCMCVCVCSLLCFSRPLSPQP